MPLPRLDVPKSQFYDQHNQLLEELQGLEKQLGHTRPGSAMALYARSIRQWVHGHYGWILSSRRYAPFHSIAA